MLIWPLARVQVATTQKMKNWPHHLVEHITHIPFMHIKHICPLISSALSQFLHKVSKLTKIALCTSNTCSFLMPHTWGHSPMHGEHYSIIACQFWQSGHLYAYKWPPSQIHQLSCQTHFPPHSEHAHVKTAKTMHHLAIQIISLPISEKELSKLPISCINMISFKLMLHQSVSKGP